MPVYWRLFRSSARPPRPLIADSPAPRPGSSRAHRDARVHGQIRRLCGNGKGRPCPTVVRGREKGRSRSTVGQDREAEVAKPSRLYLRYGGDDLGCAFDRSQVDARGTLGDQHRRKSNGCGSDDVGDDINVAQIGIRVGGGDGAYGAVIDATAPAERLQLACKRHGTIRTCLPQHLGKRL